MNKHSDVKFKIKTYKQSRDMWSFCIGLSHFVDETYLYINFFRWSISIGYLYEYQGQYMNSELFEKRILYESLSQIMENQKNIMRHLGITRYCSDWGYDDDYTRELIEQCNGIANEIRWEECQ